jgi:hypothetical protein
MFFKASINDMGRDFRIFHHQTLFPEVIEGKLWGRNLGRISGGAPENLPKFDENLRFFPPILEAIRTFVYPSGVSEILIR